jgi:hypothetical protein
MARMMPNSIALAARCARFIPAKCHDNMPDGGERHGTSPFGQRHFWQHPVAQRLCCAAQG